LNGRVAILTTHIDDRITVQGNGSNASVIVMGVYAEQKKASTSYFVNGASPAAHAVLANSRQLATTLANNRSVPTQDEGGGDPAFVEIMLSHTRLERAEPLGALPAGVTDVRMFRVGVSKGLNNVTLKR
jgi:hypothetical protein